MQRSSSFIMWDHNHLRGDINISERDLLTLTVAVFRFITLWKRLMDFCKPADNRLKQIAVSISAKTSANGFAVTHLYRVGTVLLFLIYSLFIYFYISYYDFYK